MTTTTLTKKEAESLASRDEKRKAKDKAFGLRMTELMTMGGACAARGLIKVKMPSLYSYQAGGIAFADIGMAAVGAVMGLGKSGKNASLGMGLFYAGVAPIAEGLGSKVASSLPSLGGV